MKRGGILTLAVCLIANILMISQARANARVEPLAVVTDEMDGDVHQLWVIVDDVKGFMGLQLRTLPEGEKVRPSLVKDFRTAEIASKAGVDLDGKTGLRAIVLQGPIEKKSTEARINIRFLKNALFGSYGICQVDFKLASDGHWQLHNIFNGNLVTKLHVKNGTFGITNIVEICK